LEDGRFKILAAYCPTPVAMLVAIVMTLGAGAALKVYQPGMKGIPILIGAVITGVFLGFLVSFFLIWLLFRLRFVEAVVGWIFTSIFYFAGGLLALFIVVLIAIPLSWFVRGMGFDPSGSSANQVAVDGPAALPLVSDP
jgi:hypothetical protein